MFLLIPKEELKVFIKSCIKIGPDVSVIRVNARNHFRVFQNISKYFKIGEKKTFIQVTINNLAGKS